MNDRQPEPGLDRAAPHDEEALGDNAAADASETGASAPEPRLVARMSEATIGDPEAIALGAPGAGSAGDRVDAEAATFGSDEDRIGAAASGSPATSVGGAQGSVGDQADSPDELRNT